MRTSRHRLALGIIIAGCQSPQTPSRSVPEPETRRPPTGVAAPGIASIERGITSRTAPPLPAIPLVTGPLAPQVVYPQANQSITVRDSNFIFGSVGNGHATLTINGVPVAVAPNGTFLGFLAVPPPTAARYELIVREGSDSARLVVPVRVPPARPDLATTGRLVIDSASVSPRGGSMTLRENEPVRVTVRAPVNATSWVAVNGGGPTYPLVNTTGNNFATDVP